MGAKIFQNFLILALTIFNLSPLFSKDQEFVTFTMPKTGTHLIDPLLEKISGKEEIWSGAFFPKGYIRDFKVMSNLLAAPNIVPLHWLEVPVDIDYFNSILDKLQEEGKFLVTHTAFSPQMEKIMKDRNCLVFFIIRDPRDFIVSVINHPNQPGADIFVQPWFRKANRDEQIRNVILGTDWYNSTASIYAKFLPWKDSSVCCAVHYEKLLGPRGGACTKNEHLAELRKISKALKINLPPRELLRAFDESFGASTAWTFKGGTTGKWKEYFSKENKALFKEHLGDLLIELGYEKDNNW